MRTPPARRLAACTANPALTGPAAAPALRLCAALMLAWLPAASPRADVRWQVTELAVPDGYATGINNAGDIVGMRTVIGNSTPLEAAWWLPADGGAARALYAPVSGGVSGSLVSVTGINNTGQMVGMSTYGGANNLVTWAAQPGAESFLVGTNHGRVVTPNLGLFSGYGINDAGVVVGSDGGGNAYTWNAGTLTSLAPQFGGFYGETLRATRINNADVVVGVNVTPAGVSSFLSNPGSTLPQGRFGGLGWLQMPFPASVPLVGLTDRLNMTVATDATGSFIGFDTTAPESTGRTWIRPAFDTLANGSTFSNATAINDFGQIVGMTSAGKAALATPYGALTWHQGGSSNGYTHNQNFSDARNWSLSDNPYDADSRGQPLLPSRFVDGRIASPVDEPVLLDTDATVGRLFIGDAAHLTYGGASNYGSLLIDGTKTPIALTVLTGLTVESGGTLISARGRVMLQTDAKGSVAPLLIQPGGVADINGLRVDGGPLTNQGTLFGNGTLDATLINTGQVQVLGNSTLLLRGTGHVNGGEITVASGGAMSVEGSLGGSGRLYVLGHLELKDGFALYARQEGQVKAGGDVISPVALTNFASFTIDKGASVRSLGYTQDGGNTLTVDGTLDMVDAKVHLVRGRIDGSGYINGDLVVGAYVGFAKFAANAASLAGSDAGLALFAPGHGAGSFTINGDFTLLPGGELDLDVARGSDGLLVTDHVSAQHMTLNGTVHFTIAAGLGNTSWEQLQFLDCGSGCVFGTDFSAVIDGGLGRVSYSGTGLTLNLAPAAAVPEPTASLLWLAGVAGLWSRRRSMRART